MVQQAGLPRTGGVSFQAAMRRLGYNPCFHSLTELTGGSNLRPALFRKIYTTPAPERYTLLRQVYDSYAAACDIPTCLFIEDLVQIYPDAKVVLGLRSSAAAWCKSHSGTIDVYLDGQTWFSSFAMLSLRIRPGRRFFGEFYAEWRRRVGGPVSTSEVYEAHARRVRAVVPETRLLEFQAADGYGPLCRFLGQPVPEEPYPRLNDTKVLLKTISVSVLIGVITWIVILSTGLALASSAWSLQARFR